MIKKLRIPEQRMATREEIVVKAVGYAKKHDKLSLTKISKLNNLYPTTFDYWIKKLGIAWRGERKKQLIQNKIKYCKNNQDKTIREICIKQGWVQTSLLGIMRSNNYYHPNAWEILKKRKESQVIKLLKKQTPLSEIQRLTHMHASNIKLIREKNHLPKCSPWATRRKNEKNKH